MGAMKKLDHDLAELIESINPDSPMLGDSETAYDARDILMSELLERGWVPPTMARANERKALVNEDALTSIAVALGARPDWDYEDLSDIADDVTNILVVLGYPSPAEDSNTDHYAAMRDARDRR